MNAMLEQRCQTIFPQVVFLYMATPIEDGVAVDGDTPPARIAGEETDEVEVVVANHVDGGLQCLHRDIELITPGSPT